MSKVTYYRADVQGLGPGQPIGNIVSEGEALSYATTNLELARAFAVAGFGVAPDQRDQELSVYEVKLDHPEEDPDFNLDATAQIVTAESGTAVALVEAKVSMNKAQAVQLLAHYLRWPDGSPAYDDDGHATVPPKYTTDNRYDTHNHRNMLNELELLGTYPTPAEIFSELARLYP